MFSIGEKSTLCTLVIMKKNRDDPFETCSRCKSFIVSVHFFMTMRDNCFV